MRTYLLYDLDVCLGECRATSLEHATQILTDRYGITGAGPWYVELA